MKNLNAIHDSIGYIESRLTEALTVQVIAQQAYFSKTHYQRLFRVIVGEPVMVYVKNRRLQLACRDILAGQLSVLATALKYGYDSHEGFTRAFKAYFGVTPLEYRKRGQQNETEVVKMLSNEVLSRIGQSAEKISAVLVRFKEDADKLAGHALKAAEAAGIKGSTTTVVAYELRNLACRIAHLHHHQVKNLAIGEASAFEMFQRIFTLVRHLDEVAFQMNLLRFLSGVETGRISPPKDEFDAIDAAFAKLCGQYMQGKEHLLALINEAISLLHADIQQEAAKRIETVVGEVTQAIAEGENTAAAAQAAVKTLGEYGKAYAHIAKEVKESLHRLESVADDFHTIHDLPAALSRLENTAFSMNLNAFNATIESLRSGNTEECPAAAEKIRKYAGTLQNTCQKCEALCGEYYQLIELTKQNGHQSEQALAEKHMDDIIWQSGILSGQFSLEAERINRDAFRTLAQSAAKAHRQLMQTREAAAYREDLTLFLEALNKEVSLLENGGSFAYFAKEYAYFLERLNA